MNSNKEEVGTIRIGKDLNVYKKTEGSWKKTELSLPNSFEVIRIFKAHNRFNELIDKKNSKFLKGQLSVNGAVQGARINILPNGQKLDKAYSLFAKDLTFNDESSHNHWDAIYQNPNGKYAYLYNLKKIKNAVANKYRKVSNFEKKYDLLESKVSEALKDEKDNIALPMYTLLKTYMRVGNEIYFKANGHKGLTTLKKRDVKIIGNKVYFNYIAKSGVPISIFEEFPKEYILQLRTKLNNLNNNDFIFTRFDKKPLKDTDFMAAFERYCGEKFYPHIVRSYYATKRVNEFIKEHRKTNKQEIKELFSSIAEKLGHKRFDKKNNEWKSSYNVTIHHYLQPETLERVNKLIT